MATFDPWAQLRVLDLQACDTALDRAAFRLKNLPEAVVLAQLSQTQADLRLREVAGITETADRELDVAKAEDDVAAVRMRSAKDDELLNSGAITDSKQLTELQHEVNSLARRQAELEDEEIEILQKLEDAQKSLAKVQALQVENKAARDAAEIAHTVAVAEIEAEVATLQAERLVILTGIPADLLKLYEKIRADNAGIGAAKLHQAKCDGCRIQLNPVAMAAARNSAPQELLRCEECRAILVRTADSGL
jgi:predicted  nucleic acid-binding Zn-ribbon protein